MQWVVAKHVLRYLARTMDFVLDYRRSEGSDWLVIQTQIGRVVWQTERALPYVVSVWAC